MKSSTKEKIKNVAIREYACMRAIVSISVCISECVLCVVVRIRLLDFCTNRCAFFTITHLLQHVSEHSHRQYIDFAEMVSVAAAISSCSSSISRHWLGYSRSCCRQKSNPLYGEIFVWLHVYYSHAFSMWMSGCSNAKQMHIWNSNLKLFFRSQKCWGKNLYNIDVCICIWYVCVHKMY